MARPGVTRPPRSRQERVLHILWNMSIGGAERAVYQLVREQRLRGIEADVLLCSGGGFYAERAREAGATVHELGQRRAADLRIARRARGVLQRYEILHVHGLELALIHLASRCEGVRRFYTHRGGVFDYSAKRLLRYKLASRHLRLQFSGVSANTRQGARAAARLFGIREQQIAVTYNGIDFALLQPRRSREEVLAELGGDPRAVRVGTSAHLRDWKRTERLLSAVSRVHDVALECVVAGDGPALAGLQQLARDLGIDDRCTFTGRVEHIGDYLQAMDVFVLPSGPEESFGNAAVEAMGVGLPTVVFEDGGGLVEHVEDGQTGFVVADVEQLSRRLLELARNETLRAELGQNARRHATFKYDVETMVRSYNALYASAEERQAV